MAIQWGAWEYGGGNGMRVGIEVDWDPVSHSDTTATARVKIYTENQFSYSDSQSLNYGGSLSGSTSFTNNDGGAAVLRATKTYNYTYGSSSYGSSPGSRTFSASLSGAYNGVTPSKSVTSNIPARPYAAPAAPTSVIVSRTTDTSTKVQWNNNETVGKPYDSQQVDREINASGSWSTRVNASGAASSYSDATLVNNKYRYRVRAENGVGASGFNYSGYIYTTPATPTGATRADAGADQLITWSNSGMGYSEYATEIIGVKNGVTVGALGTVAGPGTSFTHTTTNVVSPYTVGDKWKYYVHHITTSGSQGVLTSSSSAFTSETAGVTSPPNAPTGLSPNAVTIDPTVAQPLTFVHNPTDTTAMTQFQIRHRLIGAGTWTTEAIVTSGTASWSLPANTYTSGQQFEWQVTTRGSHATFSPWSDSATVTAFITKKVPMLWNVGLGAEEADVSGFDFIAVGAMTNSWVNFGGGFSNAGYCRRGAVVYLKGLIKSGVVANGATGNVFVLPAGYRPKDIKTFVTIANNALARVDVLADGTVRAVVGSNVWLTFDGICFPAEQ